MNSITRMAEGAQLAWTSMRPENRRLLRAIAAATVGIAATALYVVAWADLGAVLGLCLGVYLGMALQDLFAAVLASLAPSTRSERRRAHRMARAAGVVIEEAS